MIELTLTNRQLFISGASRKTLRKLEALTSYRVAGFQFAPSFRTKRWDGKEHLLTFSKRSGYHVPSGLLLDVVRALKRLGAEYKLIDKTCVRHKRCQLAWNESIVLRDYQTKAVKTVLGRPLPGVGVLKMPIRSGKTKTAAALIHRLGRPTLFIVPSQWLLHQTVEVLRDAFPGVDVGKIGEGTFEPGFVTVATIQTLNAMRGRRSKGRKPGKKPDPRYKPLMSRFDVVIVDEAHHFRGDGEWHKVVYDLDARFKMALSATVFMDSDAEVERGIIWLKATCGPIRVEISPSSLIDQGYLMRQNVRILRVTTPDLNGKKWSQKLRYRAIINNASRNRKIAKVARFHSERGHRVVIIANRLAHIAAINEMLEQEGVDYRVITGKDGADDRESKVDGLIEGLYNVLIGTVLGEGIDLPEVEIVINAEGGKSDITTFQRQRNLTKVDGKETSVMYDFMDETNDYFKKHSEARLQAYKSEPAYRVRLVD